jgi:uncharacterized protein YggT (Ycf19 family)
VDTVGTVLSTFLNVYLLCIFVWALLSWIPMISPSLAYNDTVVSLRGFLDSIVLPWVKLFSFIKPVQMGGTYLDLSALVAILVLIAAQKFVLPAIFPNLA